MPPKLPAAPALVVAGLVAVFVAGGLARVPPAAASPLPALRPAVAPAQAGASASLVPPALRAQRARLLDRLAVLTDAVRSAEARVVTAELMSSRATTAFEETRALVREQAVSDYIAGFTAGYGAGYGAGTSNVTGPPLPIQQVTAGSEPGAASAYLQVAMTAERSVLASFETGRSSARGARAAAVASRDALSAVVTKLAATRQALDQQVARAVARARALATQRVVAQETAARQAALAAAGSPAGGAPGAAASPLGLPVTYAGLPLSLGPTLRQNALMARYSFGPLPAGVAAPLGLVATGQVVAGVASWYGPGFEGRPTASGAIFDELGWTAASRTLPLGTILAVRHGGLCVVVLVNDRGPYVAGRVLDLSYASAAAIGITGLGQVQASVLRSSGG